MKTGRTTRAKRQRAALPFIFAVTSENLDKHFVLGDANAVVPAAF